MSEVNPYQSPQTPCDPVELEQSSTLVVSRTRDAQMPVGSCPLLINGTQRAMLGVGKTIRVPVEPGNILVELRTDMFHSHQLHVLVEESETAEIEFSYGLRRLQSLLLPYYALFRPSRCMKVRRTDTLEEEVESSDWLTRLEDWMLGYPIPSLYAPILGELTLEDSHWIGNITTSRGPLEIAIGGQHEPDSKLLNNAQEIFLNVEPFLTRIDSFLSEQARDRAWLGDVPEIESLRPTRVELLWRKRPCYGVVWLKSRETSEMWRCKFEGDRLYGLTRELVKE